jgi:hypothetical protein
MPLDHAREALAPIASAFCAADFEKLKGAFKLTEGE